MTDEEKKRGVIAASAGNHAQGVALAAQMHNIKATIVLPEFAPLTKIMATKSHGAEVDDARRRRLMKLSHIPKNFRKNTAYTYVHAFDDEKIIAGQGTIGLEIVRRFAASVRHRRANRRRRPDFGNFDCREKSTAQRPRRRRSGSKLFDP